MSREFEFSIETSDSDLVAIATPVNTFDDVSLNSTEYHEAVHTVAAFRTGSKVVEASNIRGPGFLGRTVLNEFNPVAFVAAFAMGCDGTSYDLAVLRWMGRDPGLLAVVARNVLAGHETEILAVAASIKRKGRISGSEALYAMNEAVNPELLVEVLNSKGERHFVSKIRKADLNNISNTSHSLYFRQN